MRSSIASLRFRHPVFLARQLAQPRHSPHHLHPLSPRDFPLPHHSPHRMSVFFDRLLNTYSKVSDALTFNAATLSGAIDIVVVQHSDDTFTSTPFHVRFGKLQLLKSREKLVTIRVNGVECQWKMKLGVAGEAFFVMDADKQQPASEEELSSPITSPVLSPAAVLTTNQGTITAVNPQPHGGSKADSGRPKQPHPHEEYKFPDLDLSQATLSPPTAYTPKQSGRGRVLDVIDGPGHGRSASDAVVAQSRFHSTPSKRLKEEEDERTVAESGDRGPSGGELDGEIADDMRWALQHESKDEISNGVRLTRQCVSAPLSPLSPLSPRSPHSPHSSASALTLTPTSQVFSDASASDGGLPPSHPLRVAASMEQTLSPGPASPRSPSSPSFLVGDDDRTLSAPSADGALDHVFTWTWGHLPVHHQRFHPSEQSRAEQVIQATPPASTSPHVLPAIPPQSTYVLLPSSAASATAAVSAASIDLKGDVVNELKQEAAAAAASLDQPHLTAAVDSRSWSVRGIFASVFSKLPARSSFSLPYAGTADAPPVAPVSEVKETTEPPQPSADSSAISASTTVPPGELSPAVPAGASVKPSHTSGGSINLAEAHLPVPWLNKGIDADAGESSPSAHTKPPEPPSHPPRESGVASPPPSYHASQSAASSPTAASDVLTSPLSAPLPSTFSPAFSLPSQARPASAMEGSLLHRPDDGQRLPSTPSTASLPASPSLQALDSSLLRLSLCGHYLGSNAELNRSLFDRHAILYEQLAAQPELTFRSDLVVLYQQRLYPSRIALPLILSHLAFGRPLAIAVEGLERLSTMPLPHPALVDAAVAAPLGSAADKGKSAPDGTSDAPVGIEAGGRSSWRDWFRYKQQEPAPRYKKPPPIDTINERGTPSAIQSATQVRASDAELEAARAALSHSKSMEAMPLSQVPEDAADGTLTTITVSGPGSPPFPFTSAASPALPATQSTPKSASSAHPSFIKSLRPTSTMLKSLGLKAGRNSVTFTVSSALQGQQTVSASIYLWDPDVKIVISDIDGTITKSDILGHVMPLVGRDWSHVGVTQLYSDIHRNGYQLLYLTSRAIGQANITRGYIQSLRQGESSLPYGPVIMSPDRLLHSFKREVIHRRPQEFKIIALRDVKGLFDDDYNPFYAGFGNRITDVVAYRAVGVPTSRIYIINHHGRIQHLNLHYSKSYPELGGLVNAMFPSILDGRKGVEEFNDLNYWKQPMASLSEDEDDDEEDSEEDEGGETAEDSEGETAKVSGSSAAAEAERRQLQKEAHVLTTPARPKVVGTV